MQHEEIGRASRWTIRAREWDDPRARYPNLWHEGMPRRILAFDRQVGRLRLGDLVATFYPPSAKHPERADRCVGLSRVIGLSRAETAGLAWADLETVHRFDPPLDLGRGPYRTFLCCDPGWPEAEVTLFREIFDAAVDAGWQPSPEDRETAPAGPAPRAAAPPLSALAPADVADADVPEASVTPLERAEPPSGETVAVGARPARQTAARNGRVFAGADFSGDMRDPRDSTWLAIIREEADGLTVLRLEATGRAGLHRRLRDPDSLLMAAEAVGLDFPFGLPLAFAEHLLGSPFPEDGWWGLARRLERMTLPAYLTALHEFRATAGEPKRLTDERAAGFSPLHRVNPDLGPMTFHGIRMIAEDRSRYAIRPFESAQARLLLEVYPGGFVRRLRLGSTGAKQDKRRAVVSALERLSARPIRMSEAFQNACLIRRDALDAVLAAAGAAAAVLEGEAERHADELAPGEGERVRREGWIYGLADAP